MLYASRCNTDNDKLAVAHLHLLSDLHLSLLTHSIPTDIDVLIDRPNVSRIGDVLWGCVF